MNNSWNKGMLFGLNEIHKNNQEAKTAYARCMQARGHTE